MWRLMETRPESTVKLLGYALVFSVAWILFASALVAVFGGAPAAVSSAAEAQVLPASLVSER